MANGETTEAGEGRLRSLAHDASGPIVVLDARGVIRHASPSVERVLGRGPRELMGKSAFDLVHPDDLDRVLGNFAAHPPDAGPETLGLRFRHADGSWRRLEAVGADHVPDDPDYAVPLVVETRDVTGRKDAEEPLGEGDDLLRAVMEGINDAVFVKDRLGRYLTINRAGAAMLGRTVGEVLGKTDAELFSAEDARGVVDEDRGVMASGETRTTEDTKKTADPGGVERTYLTTRGPYRDRQGGVAGVFGLSRDVTERKRAEEALREAEERYRTLVESSPEAIAVHDGRRLLFVNPAGARLFGADAPEDLVGREVLGFVHPDDRGTVASRVREVLGRGEGTPLLEERYVRLDGGVVDLEVTGRPITYAGKPAVQAVLRDVTQRKRAEGELKRSEETHRRRARELALLHEVRTALSTQLDPKVVFRSVVEAVAGTYGYALVSAYLLEGPEEDAELVLEHQVGYRTVPERVPLAEGGVMGRVARTGRPVLLGDAREDPELLGAVGGVTSGVCVPLFDGEAVVGTLNVEGTAVTRLTENDLRLLEAVAGHAGDALGRARLHAEAREAEARYRALVENIPAVVYIDDADETNSVIYRSPYVREVLGYEPEEFLSDPEFWQNLLHPEDRERVLAENERTNRTGEPFRIEYRMIRKDGSAVWLRDEAVLIRDEDGRPRFWQGYFADVTDRKEAEARLRETEARYRTLVENIPAMTYIQERHHHAGGSVWVSPQVRDILGYEPEEYASPGVWADTLHPDDRERVLLEDRRTDETGEPFSMEYRQFHKNGWVVWLRDEASVVPGEDGEPRYWLGVKTDVTERKALEERLKHRAFHDPLTELPNRALLSDRLGQALGRARRRRAAVAVLFVDLDDFKYVNDSLGHEAGDALLVSVAARLRSCLRPEDTVARLGGDEFAVVIEEAGGVAHATRVAERIVGVLRAPFCVGGHELFVGASVGVALGAASAEAREGPEDLLRKADLALYDAKRGGKARHAVFDPEAERRSARRLTTENGLRRAVERGELVVHYQPVVLLHDGRIVGFEALVRWEHPERGLIPPSEFVPLAEENGLIVPIGRRVLREACRQAKGWHERCPREPPLTVGVNLSARQLSHPGVVGDVEGVLRETGLDPGRLTLEITESALVEEAGRHLGALRGLEGLGVRLALDDFGTGYSSLSYLGRLPAGLLKLDGSFVGGVGEGTEERAEVLLEGVIGIAHGLGLGVCAEGVETAGQAARLRELGCDLAQGHHFSGPLPPEEASRLLTGVARGDARG